MKSLQPLMMNVGGGGEGLQGGCLQLIGGGVLLPAAAGDA
eukprot:CAMPEP_0202363730 /NCGR_PEP_ID=MMETSP1126-20121109/15405_1 /ASSEMBLY_ACC=CAM_ASM_000457 /TAXON_ID=3047 /ORGANISM="Dunaliella tertiolecta, Strain CCMP1320" /LENGTH=39 /DNA_ID= /DNA_START= /DNA_END= /DNA_ORIENTATION=